MNNEQHSVKFNYYFGRYLRNGCTVEQLQKLVELGVLHDWEYERITGKPIN